uniref:IS3 family transposase n=1 Tax=Lactiplantibacillus plantarum TaxID=1590 RepID=UPI001300E05B
IMHSDQGWQYQHKDYQNAMKELRVTPSMSRKGNCHDNAPMESFFNLMKRECLYRTIIDNLEDLKQVVTNYIVWYNTKRISINKNGLTPVEYREQAIA